MRLAVRGVTYGVDVCGDGPAVVLLHGFTGTADMWLPFLPVLEPFRVLRVDLLGHGRSDCPDDPERYRMEEAVADIFALLDRLGIGTFAPVGYSMGGRVALRLALADPNRCWALVLESASPGITDPDERRRRIASDEELAGLVEREGIEAFVRVWESLPLWASQQRLSEPVRAALRAQRLKQRPEGLAGSLRGLGAGRDEPVLERLGELGALPVLLITGSLDEKYVALARRMVSLLPNGSWQNIPNAGHAVHLEEPEIFATVLSDFLSKHAQVVSEAER